MTEMNSLKSRTKGQKLTYEEKMTIYQQIKDGTTVKDIWEIWQVSVSTINRIVKSVEMNKLQNKFPLKIWSRVIQSKRLWEAISSYAEQNKWSFTWNDVRNHLMKYNDIWVNTNLIRKILKNKLSFSFKRCSSRPITLNWKILKLKKILFLVRLCKMINRHSILANIDESSFSRNTKTNYSWSRKGEPSNWSTILFSGSISIVSAILSNGISVTGAMTGTMDQDVFIEFIEHLLVVWSRL